MPFTKHIIEPINISQCPLPPGEPNELECISNLTLANVIRQLSSLGQHAGRIFDDLVQDVTKINNRSQLLSQRIDNLKQKVTNLDIQNEEVSLEDCHNKKQFRNTVKIDQKVVSRKTMPEAMRLMYENADPPPALDRLNPYRRDGKDCMKFYTDPEFFFNIWCNELIKDNEARKKEKKRRKTGGGEKQNLKSPHKNDLTEQSNLQMGPNPQFRLDVDPKQNLIQNQILKHQQISYPQQHFNGNFSEQSLPPPPQHILKPDSHMSNYEIYAESNQMNNGNRNNKLMVQQVRLSQTDRPGLPPPPIPDNNLSDLQQIQQQMMRKFDHANSQSQNPNSEFNCDLPPPPSPPNFSEQSKFNISLNQRIVNMTISQKKTDTPDSVIDMPLPPPPIELQDTIELPPPISPPGSKNNHPPLPPPPPLPPLVESDSTSSTSSLSATNTSTTAPTPKPPIDKPSATPSFLDDINKKRFVLKPTKVDDDKKNGRNDSGREAIQCLVNNSDVAAIIDFVRKFRPHVRDSSDEEENSDWDE